jgi:hypothetical protein
VRVATDTQFLDVEPGASADVVVEIVNTAQVIDGMTARVIGLPAEAVTSHPQLLPLFPDSSGQLTLSLTVPPTQPAGRHPLTVEITSQGARLAPAYVDVDMQVSAHPALGLAVQPKVIRARWAARFVLELHNQGNVPLQVTMRAIDPDRAITAQFSPETLRVDPGAKAPVLLHVRGPRMFTGAEIDRSVTVEASATRVDIPPDAENEPEVQAAQTTTVRLRQRPTISRGLLTILILAAIVALWALVFLLGIAKVFANDPMTKQVPASFFAASAAKQASTPKATNGGQGGGGAGAAPAGALPKSGQVPPGVGGQITGTVTAASDHQPVGRILVRAWRKSKTGLKLVSSAASQTDGTYTLAGLFPTSYYIEFSAAGFKTVWYDQASGAAAASAVSTAAQGTTKNVNAVISGKAASISGVINPGDTLQPVTTTVTARPLTDAPSGTGTGTDSTTGPVAATAKTDRSGAYTLTGLPAPGRYQLSFTAAGYQVTTIVDTVNGGEQRLEPTVRLGATVGQISGTVRGNGEPLGGASVRTTVSGKAITVMTPTTGTVGAFTLGNLPTPATYVITFTAPGYGTQTTIIDLKAGQSRTDLHADLAAGTGSVSGMITGPDGKGLGGVKVTVGGTATESTESAPTTTTLTKGSVGSYVINGLKAPGSYTLTFTKDGYAPASVPVTLSGNGAPPTADARLSSNVGSLRGQVTGASCAGATITARNGQPGTAWTGTASSGDCHYQLAGLPPGTYSVTVTADGKTQQTAIVTVTAGNQTTVPTLRLGG